MSSRAAPRMRMTWFAVAAGLSALTACSILDGPTEAPATANFTVGGPGPGPLTLVTSNNFGFIFDNFGNRREELLQADTSSINPGYEAELSLGPGARVFISVGRPAETEETPHVSLTLFVRDEAICQVEAILSEENPELVCTYTFN